MNHFLKIYVPKIKFMNNLLKGHNLFKKPEDFFWNGKISWNDKHIVSFRNFLAAKKKKKSKPKRKQEEKDKCRQIEKKKESKWAGQVRRGVRGASLPHRNIMNNFLKWCEFFSNFMNIFFWKTQTLFEIMNEIKKLNLLKTKTLKSKTGKK
jgi:hypothetical protein